MFPNHTCHRHPVSCVRWPLPCSLARVPWPGEGHVHHPPSGTAPRSPAYDTHPATIAPGPALRSAVTCAVHEPLPSSLSFPFLSFFTVLGSPVAVGDAPTRHTHRPATGAARPHRLASARDVGALLTSINYDQQPLQEMAVGIADLARAGHVERRPLSSALC